MSAFIAFVNVGMFVLLAPLVQGLIKKIKAFLQVRQGPPILQMYSDIFKYWHKESVMSEHASVVFKTVPYVVFAVTIVLTLLIPGAGGYSAITSWGDFIVILYLFAVIRFAMALAGLDAGSSFGGMGSSREMLIGSLTEPAFFAALLGLALRTHTLNLQAIAQGLNKVGLEAISPSYVLALVAALIILVTETGRIPIDNPDTHLELTMIHEGMILEYTGKELMLMHWAAAIKQFLLLSILANLFLPWGIVVTGLTSAMFAVLIFFCKLIFLIIFLAFTETALVKVRIFRAPDVLAMSFLFAVLAIVSQYYL